MQVYQTVLSRVRQSTIKGALVEGCRGFVIAAQTDSEAEPLPDEAVEAAEELTRWVVSWVSEDCGLRMIGMAFELGGARPLTGELPEVKPSSAELE